MMKHRHIRFTASFWLFQNGANQEGSWVFLLSYVTVDWIIWRLSNLPGTPQLPILIGDFALVACFQSHFQKTRRLSPKTRDFPFSSFSTWQGI